jgi:YD repeat-containing protein
MTHLLSPPAKIRAFRNFWHGNTVNSGNSQSFVCDNLQRLTEATGSYGSYGYTYDGFGQRLLKTFSGTSGEIYQYGQNGMLLEETDQSGCPRKITLRSRVGSGPAAGIVGPLLRGVRSFGLRRSRYRGLRKGHLQNVAVACPINLRRLMDY